MALVLLQSSIQFLSNHTAFCARTVVTVDVNNLNDAPIAVNDTLIVDEDSLNNSLAVLTNDSDPDIGDTFIGMHIKRTVVPVRGSIIQIGQAHVTMATTRPKLIGGERSIYKKYI